MLKFCIKERSQEAINATKFGQNLSRGQCWYCIALEVMQETVLLLHCLGGDAGVSAGIALPWR